MLELRLEGRRLQQYRAPTGTRTRLTGLCAGGLGSFGANWSPKALRLRTAHNNLAENRIGTRLSLELRSGCAAHSHEDRNVIRVVNTARDASERYIVHCPLMLPPQRRYLRARSRVVAAEVPAIANSRERINSAVDSQPAAARALRAIGCCASITVRSQSILRQQWRSY